MGSVPHHVNRCKYRALPSGREDECHDGFILDLCLRWRPSVSYLRHCWGSGRGAGRDPALSVVLSCFQISASARCPATTRGWCLGEAVYDDPEMRSRTGWYVQAVRNFLFIRQADVPLRPPARPAANGSSNATKRSLFAANAAEARENAGLAMVLSSGTSRMLQ